MTPTQSDQSAAPSTGTENQATRTSGDNSSVEQKPDISKAVEARLARERAKHAKELTTAQERAVADFKAQHGITDEALAELGEGRFSGLYKRISELEGQVVEHQRKEAQAQSEQRQAAISEQVFKVAADLNLPVLDDARKMVLRDLDGQLDVDGDGKVIVAGDAAPELKDFLRSYLDDRAFLVEATGQSGAGSTRSQPTPQPPGKTQRHELLGDVPVMSAADRRRAWATHATGRRR